MTKYDHNRNMVLEYIENINLLPEMIEMDWDPDGLDQYLYLLGVQGVLTDNFDGMSEEDI